MSYKFDPMENSIFTIDLSDLDSKISWGSKSEEKRRVTFNFSELATSLLGKQSHINERVTLFSHRLDRTTSNQFLR